MWACRTNLLDVVQCIFLEISHRNRVLPELIGGLPAEGSCEGTEVTILVERSEVPLSKASKCERPLLLPPVALGVVAPWSELKRSSGSKSANEPSPKGPLKSGMDDVRVGVSNDRRVVASALYVVCRSQMKDRDNIPVEVRPFFTKGPSALESAITNPATR